MENGPETHLSAVHIQARSRLAGGRVRVRVRSLRPQLEDNPEVEGWRGLATSWDDPEPPRYVCADCLLELP